MTRTTLAACCWFALCVAAWADDDGVESVALEVPGAASAVWSADNLTLIVSAPAAAKLYYVNAAGGEIAREVEVDFQPDMLAIQGDTLFASTKGAPVVHVLDAKTGKEKSEIRTQGEGFRALACHPKIGPLFAANTQEEVWMLDPVKSRGVKTNARGMFLAIDPTNGKTLFTGTNRPSQEFIEVQRNGQTARVRLVTVAERASILKYQLAGNALKLVGGNTNAAIGAGGYLTVSADGKRVALAAGGGWRSLTDRRAHYVIPVFDAKDPENMLGRVETDAYPQSIAFHPVLNLGAASRDDGEITLFKSTSLAAIKKFKLGDDQLANGSYFISFGGKGTRLVYYTNDTLHIVPIELATADKAQLIKAYGKLPSVASGAAADATAKSPEGGKANAAAGRKNAKPILQIGDDASRDEILEVAKQGMEYITDQPNLKIKTLPKELEGTQLLARPSGMKMRWIDFPQWYRVTRGCTVYVALVTEEDGFRRVSKADYKRLLDEGWKEHDWEFATELDDSDFYKPTWKVLSRNIKAGPLDIRSRIDVSKCEVLFFFKE